MNERAFDSLSKTMAGGLSRRQMLRLVGGGATAGALAVAGLGTVRSTSAQTVGTDPGALPVTGSGITGGVFSIAEFAIQQGQLVALGTLTGTDTDDGSAIAKNLAWPVLTQASTATCEILNLVLGPLDLTLLGLNIFLDTVTLIITADPTGGLLGGLLCAIANLLNGPGNTLRGLVNLLNQLLGALSGL